MSKLFGEQFDYGTVDITTDGSGNGTATVTFGTAFDKAPEVKVVKPLNDENGHYGAYNSPDMLLYSGKQPIGGIASVADNGSGYAQFTDSTALSKSITVFTDNGDGRTKITAIAHGFTVGNAVQITGTMSYNGFVAVLDVVDANNFIIDKPFVADDAAGTAAILSPHDLAVDDIIEIKKSKNYSGEQNVTAVVSHTFDTDKLFVAEANTPYWIKKPSITITTFIAQVLSSDVKGGTVSVHWLAVERQ